MLNIVTLLLKQMYRQYLIINVLKKTGKTNNQNQEKLKPDLKVWLF